MLTLYAHGPDGRLVHAPSAALGPGALWIDLYAPTDHEERAVEAALNLDVPTPEDRAAYEDSARLYAEDGALFLTATLLGRREDGAFISGAVTFVLTPTTLVTVREIRPRAFDVGQGRASARIERAMDAGQVFIALLEGCVERIADLLQELGRDTADSSQKIFAPRMRAPRLQATLRELGQRQTLNHLCHDSLSSLQRMMSFADQNGAICGLSTPLLRQLTLDVEQLERKAEAQSGHLGHLQDAVLGLVNAEQNNGLKALSILTIAFAPPTLISSVFGMNFQSLAWIHAPWGPWAAGVLMLGAPMALLALGRKLGWF